MPWKPISTAPRNGKVIQVRDADGDLFLCRWLTKKELDQAGFDADNGWYEAEDDEDVDGDEIEPVLWLDNSEEWAVRVSPN